MKHIIQAYGGEIHRQGEKFALTVISD